jgi:hypothetical protein
MVSGLEDRFSNHTSGEWHSMSSCSTIIGLGLSGFILVRQRESIARKARIDPVCQLTWQRSSGSHLPP